MTELKQAEFAEELGTGPAAARGWTWTWQRCGRYGYRKCLTHSTNPDHLVAKVPSPTRMPSLRVVNRYVGVSPTIREA